MRSNSLNLESSSIVFTQPFSIAIDGHAGMGKSTVAKAVAAELNALYLDTGAMYSVFGLYMMRKGTTTDTKAIIVALDDADVSVEFVDGIQRKYLGDEDVTDAIRTPEVSMAASDVAAVPEVRERMVALQRQFAEGYSVIMEGHDIGTEVLPNGTLKIYMTASAEERAHRRWRELEQIGTPEPYDTNLNLNYNHMRASFPPCRCFTAVNDALASPPSVQLRQNVKSTPHMITFRLRLV